LNAQPPASHGGVSAAKRLRLPATRSARRQISLIQWAPGLPKTRFGKIMRRILRKIATNERENLGDTSTLADPGVADKLIHNRENK